MHSLHVTVYVCQIGLVVSVVTRTITQLHTLHGCANSHQKQFCVSTERLADNESQSKPATLIRDVLVKPPGQGAEELQVKELCEWAGRKE